jgi:hypothetical protein
VRALLPFTFLFIACGSSSTVPMDGGADAGPPGWKHGVVALLSTTRGRVNANFVDAPDGYPPMISTSREVGPCQYTGFSSLAGAGTATPRSAGVITVDGAKVPITLTPAMPTPGYPPFQSPMPLWSGGETITVTAAGADVPAFTAHATAPARVTVTAPAAGMLTLPRSADLTVTWTNGGAGEVHLTLDADPSAPLQGSSLDCRFPSSAGTATVPSAALQLLPAGHAQLQIATGAPIDLQAGDYALQISVTSDAGYAGAMVTLQ